MKRIAAFAAAVLALAAGTAHAVKYGEPDGNRHPYVGLMVAKDASGAPLWRCSGTLLSPRLYLTAGHCTEAPAATAEIWFAADVESGIPGNGYPFTGEARGTVHTHPSFNPDAFFQFDLGVVVLDAPVILPAYGALPALDQLDALATARGLKDQGFTSVGYGLQFINPVFEQAERVRMLARPHLIQINTGFTGTQSILLSNNHATGGTCFGDSGGPNFIGDTNIVGGVTSFGINGNCAGTGGVYRVDRADDLGWIRGTFGAYLP